MRRIFLLPVLFCLVSITFLSFSDKDPKYPNGSPGGYTGSPADGQSCTACHGSATNISNVITSNVPASGYVAGTQYTMTITLPGSGKKGFEVSPQSLSGALLGTLAAGTGSKLTNGGKALTQTTNLSANPAIWTFTWTAPAAGTGPVTFYGAYCIGEPNIKLNTFVVPEFAVGINEGVLNSLKLYPIPAHDMINVTYSLNSQQSLSITLYDCLGKQHKLMNGITGTSGNHNEHIALPENLAPGLYYLHISTPQKTTTSKIIIY